MNIGSLKQLDVPTALTLQHPKSDYPALDPPITDVEVALISRLLKLCPKDADM
jgi:hypothetical protein